MRSLNIAIPDEAATKLAELAAREFRRPKEQAALLIVDGLRRAGLEAELRSDEMVAAVPSVTERRS